MGKTSYLNLRLGQFLDAITDKKKVYQFTTFGTSSNITGTLPELYSFISQFNIETRQKLEQLIKDKKEYEVDFELNDIEIYNYLEKTTSNFDEVKTKIILRDIEVYYSMDFRERIEAESSKIFNENKWEIPLITVVAPLFNKGEYETPNIEKMLKKTHPVSGFTISKVISLLKQKLETTQKVKDEKENNITETKDNPHKRIFKESKHFELFEHLRKQVTKNELAEFSFIYWVMFQDSFIDEGVKSMEFINWLSKTYEIELTELKQFNRVNTGSKPANYQTAKLLFQC